jgi:hypothetical protein
MVNYVSALSALGVYAAKGTDVFRIIVSVSKAVQGTSKLSLQAVCSGRRLVWRLEVAP